MKQKHTLYYLYISGPTSFLVISNKIYLSQIQLLNMIFHHKMKLVNLRVLHRATCYKMKLFKTHTIPQIAWRYKF